ncbi:uncharacterized protein LOC122501612 isoform X1 [Leptopilina heterotoma]|uniref:uncharacterized protein LOC122501612 isoform X1 n=1 Tax=Leptopilina heterotoma TaxID=63436 RepID=UPI001CA7F1FD|nr:uncharacterized protein LOC122501612 isoform X1 [Leptopilina heterotoma]
MDSRNLYSFIISLYLTLTLANSLSHAHFNVAPIKLTKTVSLENFKNSQKPQFLDTIDEEINFWSIPQQEEKHHSTKVERFSKLYEGESNLIENQSSINPINFSTWFGLPNNLSKYVPKTGKALDSKIFHQNSEKLLSEKYPEIEKVVNVKNSAETKNDIDISDLMILDELSEKLNDKSVSLQSQKEFFPKLFSPSGDIFKNSYLKNEFGKKNLLNKEEENSVERVENNSYKRKEVDFDESKIQKKPKDIFSLESKNSAFLFKDLKNIPGDNFSQAFGNLYKSESSVEVPKFSVFKHLKQPKHSVAAMTSVFFSPSRQNHFKEMRLHDDDAVDFEMPRKIFKSAGKLFFNRNFTSDNKKESVLNEWNQNEEKKDLKSKKETEKRILNVPANYPVLYQFLEKFSDKIFGAALKYELFNHYENENSTKY